ncbi:hypothetical protein ACFL9T_23180 [Thermodesulfobacteriota bacterium]
MECSNISFRVLVIIFCAMLTSCLASAFMELSKDPNHLDVILKNFKYYYVYHSGGAVLFDDARDNVTLSRKGWKPVKDKNQLHEVLASIDDLGNRVGSKARVYVVKNKERVTRGFYYSVIPSDVMADGTVKPVSVHEIESRFKKEEGGGK